MKNCYLPNCVTNRGKLVEGISSTDKTLLTTRSRPVWEMVIHWGVSDARSSEPVLYTPFVPQASVVPASSLATGGTQPVFGEGGEPAGSSLLLPAMTPRASPCLYLNAAGSSYVNILSVLQQK